MKKSVISVCVASSVLSVGCYSSAPGSVPKVQIVSGRNARSEVVSCIGNGQPSSITKDVINIGVKHTHLINLDKNPGAIFISDPEVADVQMLSHRVVCVFGLKNGETTLVINDVDHNNLVMTTVKVAYNMDSIQELIKEAYPDAKVDLKCMNDAIMVSGTVADAKVASCIIDLITKTCGDDAKIVNNMKVQAVSQVMLKVKIAEVKRSVVKNFGINWVSFFNGTSSGIGIGLITAGLSAAVNTIFGSNSASNSSSNTSTSSGNQGVTQPATTVGQGNGQQNASQNNTTAFSDTFSAIGAASKLGTLSSADAGASRWIVGYKHGDNLQFNAILDALANESMAVILAEPTLVAQSGKTAVFKAGGEKGYLVPSTSVGTSPTTEFKEWGTSIEFTPVVLDGDRIHMKVHPKVSSLVTDVGTNDIPSLNSREVETTVELNSGQSIAIAGLLQIGTTNMSYATSPLAHLPFVGGLFRSSRKIREETELVVIVTPYVVKPTDKQLHTPVDNLPRMFSPLRQGLSGRFMHLPDGSDKKDTSADVPPHIGHIIT